MSDRRRFPIMVAAALVLITAVVAAAQGPPPPEAHPAPAGTDFKPGFDDLMTMLVQPRHIKLYYSGAARNWELAAAQARDLRAALKRIAETLPVYQGNDVDAAMTSIILPKVKAVDAAIAAADPVQFTTAYADLTTACTACHTYLEHPFLVIKVPDGAPTTAYPDQEFGVARE